MGIITIDSNEPINDIIRLTREIEDFPRYKYTDMVDAMFTIVESLGNGSLSYDDDLKVILKRVLSDELFLIINENNIRYVIDLIKEAITYLSSIMVSYDLFGYSIIVTEVSLEKNKIYFEKKD